MRKLDYSNLMHRNHDVPRNHSVRNSFYMRKGNGRTGMYNDQDSAMYRFSRLHLRYAVDLSQIVIVECVNIRWLSTEIQIFYDMRKTGLSLHSLFFECL